MRWGGTSSCGYAVLAFAVLALWCNWLTRRPLKAKSPGSSPGNATKIVINDLPGRFEVAFWCLFARSGRKLMNSRHLVGLPSPAISGARGEQRLQRTMELCEASTKLHFLCAVLWWDLFAFVMPAGIGECNPPIPEGPFPLDQSSRAQGLQEVGQRPVQQTVKEKLGEAIAALVREEL